MKEIESRWILQEVFIHPEVKDKKKGILNVEIFSECKKEGKFRKVVVEVVGGIFDGERQVANIRFVNVSKIEYSGKKSSLLKKVEDAKLKELFSFLPMYLIKGGIFVEGVEIEV